MEIAVTGHRGLADTAALRAAIAEGLASAREIVRVTRDVDVTTVDGVRLSLADGADQIAAEVALDMGLVVRPLLPGAVASFVQSLPTPGAVERFHALLARCAPLSVVSPGGATDGAAMHEAHAAALVRHSSVAALVAVVDVRRGDGGPGGTESVIRHAVDCGLPIVTVDPVTGGVAVEDGLGEDLREADAALRDAVDKADDKANRGRAFFTERARTLASLSIAAVLMAAVPVTIGPHWKAPAAHTTWVALSIVEVLVLLFGGAYVAYNSRASVREDWVRARTHWALLTRERFLFAAGVGRYRLVGGRAASRPARVAELRRQVTSIAAMASASKLRMAEVWSFVDAEASPSAPTAAFVAWYRRARVVDQADYFRVEGERRHGAFSSAELVAPWALVVALLGVLVHLGVDTLAPHDHGHPDPRFLWAGAVGKLVSLVSPVVAAAASTVVTVSNDGPDAHRFRAFAELMDGLKQAPAAPSFDARAWVVQAEGLLLAEHLAWRAGMNAQDLRFG